MSSPDSFLCKWKDRQEVKLPSALTTMEPVLWDGYSGRQGKNGNKTIGIPKSKKVVASVVLDLLATWAMTETLNWQGISHGRADRESATLGTDSEYYGRTQWVIRYRNEQMIPDRKNVEQCHCSQRAEAVI